MGIGERGGNWLGEWGIGGDWERREGVGRKKGKEEKERNCVKQYTRE